MRQFLWGSAYLLLPLLAVFHSIAAPSALDNPQNKAIYDAYLAPCCWHESLAVHRSDTALQLRSEIAAWSAAGDSPSAIRQKLIDRYGVRILRTPPPDRAAWLFLLPVIALALGLAAVLAFIFKQLLHAPANPVTTTGSTLPTVDDLDFD